MKEHVIAFSDKSVPNATHLDINNGFLYDAQGVQIARWSVKEGSKEQALQRQCAAYARHESLVLMGNAYRSGFQNLAAVRDGKSEERAIAMELGVNDVHLPAALPNFAGGYRNFQPIADMAAPPVVVPKPADKYFVFDSNDAYQIAEPTVGAPAGQVNEVSPRLTNSTFTTLEYALGGFVSTQLEAAADSPLRIRQATTKRILIALLMRRELRVANLLNTTGNWNSNNVVTLGAGFQWNGGASADPVKDIHARMEASLGEISGMIMSEPLWHAFQRNPNVQKYFAYKSGAQPIPDAVQMSAVLQLPPIYVGKMKYKAVNGGALTFMWGNNCILIRQPDQMPPTSQDDIATAYTFRWSGSGVTDGQAQGGFIVREFFNQVRGSQGGTQLVVIHHDTEVMTSGFVGGLIAAAYQ